MEQITRILEEARGINRVTTLEKTDCSRESGGRYKIKTVKLEYYNSETAAREAFYKTAYPRKGRTAKK